MKKTILVLAFLLASGASFLPKVWADTPASRNLIPVPSEVKWQEGSLAVDPHFSVTANGAVDSRVEGAIKRFTDRLQKRTGVVLSGKADQASLVIEVENKGLPIQTVREDESYTLVVTPKQATLTASNPLGVLRGLQTLLQLTQKNGKGWAISSATIHDKPRFAWRGLMIDSCRHWQPMDVILRNLDGMEEAKLNVFHWHLSENQGFRVESLKFPKLQGMGSDGNYYTQKQIREVVDYARARGIRVYPEFDMPGHSTAMLVGYPELASGPGPFEIDRGWGVFNPCLNPANEAVYKFLDTFVAEMASLFPDEYFHIGGDEVDGVAWNSNLEIRDFMVEHDLKTNADLQAYFNTRLSKIVTKCGKKMVGWDEIFHPDLPKSIVVHSWRGADSLAETARKGYDGILSNGYYLDIMQLASDHYGVDPLPDAKSDSKKGEPLTKEQRSHVLGGEACMWSEFVSPETIDSRIWPRMLAVAERLWSPSSVKDVDDFYRRMNNESHNLTELGLTHETSYPIMLKRLVAGGPIDSIKALADVVEPVKYYHRGQYRRYTQDFPLNRLVDTSRADSEVARQFKKQVNQFLSGAPSLGGSDEIQATLTLWANNNKTLEPLLGKSELGRDAVLISRELSDAGQVGLEALQYLRFAKTAPSNWLTQAGKVLEDAQKPDQAVQLAIVSSIRKLVFAAGSWDKLEESKGKAWNESLDAQVKAAYQEPAW